MRNLDKIEKYLKRYSTNIEESERSRYFKLNGCTIRVSDHFSVNSACYISILIPTNECGSYIITNPRTAKVAVVNYEELKGIVKSLAIIPDVIYNAEQLGTQSINAKIAKLEEKNNNLKKTIEQLQTASRRNDKLNSTYNNLLKAHESLKIKYSNVQAEMSKLISSKKEKTYNTKTVYGIHETNIPLAVREQVKKLIEPYK